jgi:hypothetical protein
MYETLRMSFEGSSEDRGSPLVVVYNPRVVPGSLFSQLQRFGLKSTAHDSLLSGHLKGSRKGFMGMIQSYGVHVEIVPVSLIG